MRHTLHVMLLLLLLCCLAGPFAAAEQRCMFDRISRKAGSRRRSLVLELPDRERGGAQVLTASVSGWAPIRFKVFSEDMNNPSKYCTAAGETRPDLAGGTLVCRQQDVFTDEKKSIILNRVLPRAIQMHVDRLYVEPFTDALVIPGFSPGDICGEFTIPSSHHTTGVSGADVFLYAAAAPTEGSILAWAVGCAELDTGRSVVGVIDFGPESAADSESSVRVAAHEIAHTIGFESYTFEDRKMVQTASGVRGKGTVVHMTTPNVLEKTRAHFNCMSAPGMELEDEGGDGTTSSHWERRNAKDELMAGLTGAGHYTALTLAAFADMGFYRVQWGMAEPMAWGKDSGCELLTQKCLTNGVTNYPEMFCGSKSNLLVCTSDRLALGYCTIYTHQNPLPAQFQYFTDPKVGGFANALMDYCPYIQEYDNMRCIDGSENVMPGSRVGPKSKCLKGDGLRGSKGSLGDVCAEVSCDDDRVSVRYLGDDTWHTCPEGGSIAPAGSFTSGKILCPRRIEVCSQLQEEDGDDSGDTEGDTEGDLNGGTETPPNLDASRLHSVFFPLVSTAFFVVAVGAVW
ncbi:GP63 group I member a protein [Trypanosoma conorhini]|uniref:Leishmanolysin-like peptidase n=1 Tax=Trypanosoma conorhini TaxID=83891 RepID=A0A3R7LV32_9TRYP|nr:GP63 group I member a protein [Trypanosoma conorhini]RNF03851.1 GP63 group I member a protein [Trypanosoma conorhini]